MRSLTAALVVTVCTVQAARCAAVASPGPRLTDVEFFSRLDLTRPELVDVQAAVAESDWKGARHGLAEYMRNRRSPRWELDSPAAGREADPESILAHRLSSIGIEWQFGEAIDWSFNPTTQPGSKWPRNHEWTWQLSRHPMWLVLARAFSATGDEKYAREFVAELRSWVHDCPVPLDKAANVPFSRWRTIEAGIRAGTVWPRVFPCFLRAKAFDDDAVVLMLKSFVDHGEYLMKFPTRGNWLTMECNGLYHVGALFPEFKEAKRWRDTAAERLDRELDTQVYPDGAQIELAPGYHGVALRNFLGPANLVRLTGFELPGNYLAKTEKMFAYFLYSMQPDFRTAPLNDSEAGSVLGYMEQGAQLFPQRQDFRWAATEGKEGQQPTHTSHVFPYAGQFIMRSGWDRNALWLCMDGGPYGFGHQHEDKLSVILTAFGQPLLVEAGSYTYDASPWRRYVLSSRAHNLVLVDGFGQARGHEPRATFVVKAPLPQVWESNSGFDHAAARYDEGWGPEAKRLVRQTRHVFFLKPELFVVADELEPLDGKAHTYEALFHLDAAEVKVDGLRVATQNPGPNLTVFASGADTVKIVKGQREPVVQGWLPDHSLGYGGIRPIPTAIFSKTASGKVTMLYVLYPTQKSASCPVTEVRLSGDALTVRFQNGPEKLIHYQPFH